MNTKNNASKAYEVESAGKPASSPAGAAEPALPGRRRSAPSGGSAAHEVASVGVILLAEPRGFCAGVDRAIEIVERALTKFGAPIYVRHEIVHNTYVVNDLKTKGAIFIEELSDVPPGATLVFSAHGVSQAVQQEARARGFQIFDATCPLVTKVHVEVAKLHKEGYEFIMIGHKGHPEVEGTMGQLDSGIHLVEDVADVARIMPLQTERLAVVTQTTLSVDDAAEISAAVKARFPQVRAPKQQDICYATQNRQDAVKVMSPQVDILIVVGSPTSSNSNRLRELAVKLGTEAYMVDDASELQEQWFAGKSRVGLTAGASAPEVLVKQVIDRIRALGAVSVRKMAGIEETIKFPLPKGLKLDAQGQRLTISDSQLHHLTQARDGAGND
jgi:4-hydroxy-3-methylbut-2-en-1-yl diphosphate reductase